MIKIGICDKKLGKFDDALKLLEKGKNLLEVYGDKNFLFSSTEQKILFHYDTYWIKKAQKHTSDTIPKV